jgi:hypothetical protein
MTDLDQDLGIFEGFDSPAEIFAYVHHKSGEAGLMEVLAASIADGADGDYLERQSAELDAVGLPVVADIVRKAARDAPCGIDLCPYTPEDRCNYISWQTSYQRKAASSRHSK